jgi:hypothetical protein
MPSCWASVSGVQVATAAWISAQVPTDQCGASASRYMAAKLSAKSKDARSATSPDLQRRESISYGRKYLLR